jgi:hypothetical protein
VIPFSDLSPDQVQRAEEYFLDELFGVLSGDFEYEFSGDHPTRRRVQGALLTRYSKVQVVSVVSVNKPHLSDAVIYRLAGLALSGMGSQAKVMSTIEA